MAEWALALMARVARQMQGDDSCFYRIGWGMAWIARAKDRYLWNLECGSNVHQTGIVTHHLAAQTNDGDGLIQ